MRRRGVTLTEVVLAFFLLLLVVVLVLQLYPMAMSSIRVSGQRAQAFALADSIMSDYLKKPFSALSVAPPKTLDRVSGRGTTFEPTVEVFAVSEPGVDTATLRGLRVRVSWTDSNVHREIVREQWKSNVER